jgi:hypothetical protein
MKTTLAKVLLAATAAAGALALSAGAANAYIVCNAEGVCWHTHAHYNYPAPGIVYHPDDWYFHNRFDNDHWRGDYHRGRGYWRNGAWVTF